MATAGIGGERVEHPLFADRVETNSSLTALTSTLTARFTTPHYLVMASSNTFGTWLPPTLHSECNYLNIKARVPVEAGSPVVWVDFLTMIKPVTIPPEVTDQAVVFLFDTEGHLVVQDGHRPKGQQWVVLSEEPGTWDLERWMRVTTRLDYRNQTWLICINGRKIAENLGFVIPMQMFHEFTVDGSVNGLVHFSVSTNAPAGLALNCSDFAYPLAVK